MRLVAYPIANRMLTMHLISLAQTSCRSKGTPPDYEDCRCDHDNLCYKVEFWPHHQPDEL
eukprot:scaffold90_cov184-Alexandrium_tamarense.AAC.5